MGLSYKKLWVKIAEQEMTKADLRKKADFSPATLTKLNKNDLVAMSVLIKICEILKCDIGDIVSLKSDD